MKHLVHKIFRCVGLAWSWLQRVGRNPDEVPYPASDLFSDSVGAVNVVVIWRNGHWYAFLWEDRFADDLLRIVGRYAIDPRMNFTWMDARTIAERLEGAVHERKVW